jgi:hypothetical protein
VNEGKISMVRVAVSSALTIRESEIREREREKRGKREREREREREKERESITHVLILTKLLTIRGITTRGCSCPSLTSSS